MIVSDVGPHDERLGQLAGGHQFAVLALQAMMRHDGAFFGEAFDVRGLLLQIAQRDEEREVRVAVTGCLEHPVEDGLHSLPESVAPRLDDHAASHFGILGEIGRPNDLLIPFGKILVALWRDGGLL